MFQNTSNEFLHALHEEMIGHEKQSLCASNGLGNATVFDVGMVSFTTPESSGELRIAVDATDDECHSDYSLVRFTDDEVKIIISKTAFTTDSFWVMQASIAHEIGHYVSMHLGKKEVSLPSLYQEELLKAYEDDDQNETIHFSVKAVIEGGYLEVEMEADIVACHLVGPKSVHFIHFTDVIKHDNLTVRLEKLNRLKKLHEMFKDQFTPTEGYSMEILFMKPKAEQNADERQE
jgi:hypothetical protein